MVTAPETTTSPSSAIARTCSTRASWLDYFEYAVKYSRHGLVTVDGPRMCWSPTDGNPSVSGLLAVVVENQVVGRSVLRLLHSAQDARPARGVRAVARGVPPLTLKERNCDEELANR